ncbi:MAG: LytTR family DNA-binding domain-containing protein, partial [Bacteroidales bacterium]|nr:LytTR family DNA-binding domain-containing protein [Bacteroidales bacterium]
NIKVIFISAFNQYAIKAFKYSAVDYILKPINILEFIKAVNKAINFIEKHNNYSILLENIKSDFPSKLAMNISTGVEFIDINDIIYIEGDGRYSKIFVKGGKEYLEAKIISYFEEILNEHIFLRIHKSYGFSLKWRCFVIVNIFDSI